MLDRDKATRLVEAARWIVTVDAEADGSVSLSDAGLDEVSEEPPSNTFVPSSRDDRDREFGDILGYEAMTMATLSERSIPRCAQRPLLFGDESVVTLPRPPDEVHRVARIGEDLLTGRSGLVGTPNGGLAEHRREKRKVLTRCRANPNVSHWASSAVRRSA